MNNPHKLFAPVDYWNATPLERRRYCNGAGARGWGALVPDTMWGLSVREAANIHDWMYAHGRPKVKDKDSADRVFLNNMIRIIDARTRVGVLRRLRYRRAHMYYKAVCRFGGPTYWRGKNK